MYRYTIYSTEEQTRKALELGAPIISYHNACTTDDIPHFTIEEGDGNCTLYIIPPAEQMLGWLEEQNILIEYTRVMGIYACRLLELHDSGERNLHIQKIGSGRKEVTLSAIDIALDYLKTKED